MKSKKYISVMISMFLIASFLVFYKNSTSIISKKLRELNYNVTYKEVFPDENLRRGVVLCIIENRCGEYQANLKYYEYYEYYFNNMKPFPPYLISAYDINRDLRESKIVEKENEKIKKEDLEKIQVLIPFLSDKEINTLAGIEYLPNLRVISLPKVNVENVDFSTYKNLEYLYFNFQTSIENNKLKEINLNENLKVKNIIVSFNKNNKKILNYEHLSKLENIKVVNSAIKNINLSNSVKTISLINDEISKINLHNYQNLEFLDLSYNPIFNIDLSKLTNLRFLDMSDTPIENIDLSKLINIERIYLDITNIKNTIDFSHNNKLRAVSIRNYLPEQTFLTRNGETTFPERHGNIKIKELDFSNNPLLDSLYISSIDLKEIDLKNNLLLKYLTLNNTKIKKLDLFHNKFLNECLSNIDDNNINILKIDDSSYCTDNKTHQNLKFKIKKNTPQNIPIYLNDKELYLDDSSNFTREDNRYVFKNIGTFEKKVRGRTTAGFQYEANVTIEVVENLNEIKINPNTGIKTYSLVIVLIIFISYLVFKKKKSYIR